MLKNEMVKNKLKKYNQEQIIELIENMPDEQQEEIVNQILNIDFEQITNLYEATKKKEKENNSIITPIDYIDKQKIGPSEFEQIKKIGEQIIQNDEFAVITMAGRTRNKIRI